MRKTQIIAIAKDIANHFEIINPELAPFTIAAHDISGEYYTGINRKKVEIYSHDGALVYSREISGTWQDMADALMAFYLEAKAHPKTDIEIWNEELVETPTKVKTIIATVPRKGGNTNEKN